MSALSRRLLVTSAAALPALAVPAVAANIDNPDAELIALGEAYVSLWPDLIAARNAFNEKAGLAEELAWQRLGYESEPEHCTSELRKRWLDECHKTGDELGSNVLWEKLSAVDWRVAPIAEQIMAKPGHSLAGLRAKVILAVHVNPDLWDEPFDDLDWDKRTIRSLIEAACSVSGLDVPQEKSEEDETAELQS
jgi:hypothetical protein